MTHRQISDRERAIIRQLCDGFTHSFSIDLLSGVDPGLIVTALLSSAATLSVTLTLDVPSVSKEQITRELQEALVSVIDMTWSNRAAVRAERGGPFMPGAQ